MGAFAVHGAAQPGLGISAELRFDNITLFWKQEAIISHSTQCLSIMSHGFGYCHVSTIRLELPATGEDPGNADPV